MKSLIIFIILISVLPARAEWLVRQIVDKNEKILRVEEVLHTQQKISGDRFVKRMNPEWIAEGKLLKTENYYQEVIFSESFFEQIKHQYSLTEKIRRLSFDWPGSEVRTLVHQGPIETRIDLTIVGDGYTLQEKERFFDDAARIANDLFNGQTFATYLPLFNVHAVFVPSKESGLTDVVRKDTALGLYRSPAGSKRAIMPGNSSAIDKAISLAPDADYPILIANDDYYGGLGGRYAISTRSLETGTVVLRHELGHNFGEVGEEYDGGQVYRGANSSRTADVPWKNWIENSNLEVFKSQFLSGNYLWANLSQKSFKTNFTFPGPQYIFDIDISAVGWQTPNDVEVLLNGQPKLLDGVWTQDRSFYKFMDAETLPAGNHTLEIREKIPDGDNVLAFANIYAHPANINKTKNFVGAFNTFYGPGQQSGYRPTYDTCLMREMRSKDFCAVDKENMWRKFLNNTGLVDKFEIKKINNKDVLSIQTPKLAFLNISLFKKINGQWILVEQSDQKREFELKGSGEYKILAHFYHPEVLNGNGPIDQNIEFRF